MFDFLEISLRCELWVAIHIITVYKISFVSLAHFHYIVQYMFFVYNIILYYFFVFPVLSLAHMTRCPMFTRDFFYTFFIRFFSTSHTDNTLFALFHIWLCMFIDHIIFNNILVGFLFGFFFCLVYSASCCWCNLFIVFFICTSWWWFDMATAQYLSQLASLFIHTF